MYERNVTPAYAPRTSLPRKGHLRSWLRLHAILRDLTFANRKHKETRKDLTKGFERCLLVLRATANEASPSCSGSIRLTTTSFVPSYASELLAIAACYSATTDRYPEIYFLNGLLLHALMVSMPRRDHAYQALLGHFARRPQIIWCIQSSRVALISTENGFGGHYREISLGIYLRTTDR